MNIHTLHEYSTFGLSSYIQLFLNGHLGRSHILAIVNSAAILSFFLSFNNRNNFVKVKAWFWLECQD